MPPGLRFEPITVDPTRIIDRSRVLRILNGRFHHRVTTVTAAAGYGKSTVLAAAVANNRLDPAGRDIWLTITSGGIAGSQLMNGIASAMGIEGADDIRVTIERITDSIWTTAPDEVALVLDDAHLIDGEGALDALALLLAELPTNGHLVMGTRHRLDLPLARLRALRQLLEIDERQLELDDDELDALERRDGQSDAHDLHLPRHVATADLQLAVGIDAGADFLWEEVLVRLDTDRLMHLRRCAVVDSLDDELVLAMTDGAFDAAALLDGVPLVEHGETSHRMHAILRDALTTRLEPGERRKALAIAAAAEQDRGNLADAASLHHLAGDQISALDAARAFAIAQPVVQTMDDVIAVRKITMSIDPDAPVTLLLDALTHFAGLEAQLAERFLAVADAAHAADDVRLETIALHRAGQSQMLHHDPGFADTYLRLGRMAGLDELPAAVHAYFSSIIAQFQGRPDESLAALDGISALGRATELAVRAERFYDLGRVEHVATGLSAEDFADVPANAAAFIGLAMWARGEASPEVALPVVSESIERVTRARYTHPIISYLTSGVQIALAAGEFDLAQRWSERAREHADSGVGSTIAELELIARVSVAAVTSSDEAAGQLLRTEGPLHEYDQPEVHQWPSRAQLGALPMVYLLRPDLRELLDQCEVGPALHSMIAAGRCLAQIREHADPSGTVDLPWGRIQLLRAHLLPHHLVELACAAISLGHDEARLALDQVSDLDRALLRVAESDMVAVSAVARDLLGSTPRPEPFTLHALVLGAVEIRRDGVHIDDPQFVKRNKVRELFALLLDRSRMQRHDICSLLWPEHHDDDRALASLRTTLSSLNAVLEPVRERGSSAFHVHVDGDTIALDSRVTCDVVEFERTVAQAQADDGSGLPARALAGYRRAAELYRGDYVDGLDAAWAVLPRLRLRTLAVSTVCRIAELEAARGEPEEAARWAERGRLIDPLNERAGRLFVAALDAMGDRSAARSAADELGSTLVGAGLELTSATTRLFDRIR
jgi:DNA-binding SARP family transcriptional activator